MNTVRPVAFLVLLGASLGLAACIPAVPTLTTAPIDRLHWSQVAIVDANPALPAAERTRIMAVLTAGAQGSDGPTLRVIPAYAFRPGSVAIDASEGSPLDQRTQVQQPAAKANLIFGRPWQGVYALTLIPADGSAPLTVRAAQVASRSGRERARRATFEAVMRDVERLTVKGR